jgi:uncharacterized BrkB/YihY/UPF0761 family membrane protein
MVYEVKRLNVWSVAKVSFVLGGVFGFLAGILLWMFADMIGQLPLSDFSDVEGAEGLGSMGAIVPFLLAVFYGVAAMLLNGLMAGIYNVLAGIVGGIECTLVAPPSPYMQPASAQTLPPVAPPPPPAAGGPYGVTS